MAVRIWQPAPRKMHLSPSHISPWIVTLQVDMVYAQSQFTNELKYIPNRERVAFIAVDFPVSEGPTQTTTGHQHTPS